MTTVRRGFAALANGDLQGVSELLADDVVWHVPGHSAIAGDYQGRTSTLAYFGRLRQLTNGTYQPELHIAVGDDEHVITVDHTTATRGDMTYGENELVVFRFRHGHIAEAWQAWMNPQAHDDFFS